MGQLWDKEEALRYPSPQRAPQKGLPFLPSCPSLSLFPPEMTLAKPAALLGKQQLPQDTEQQIQVCGGRLEEPSRAPSWLVGASFFSQIADWASIRPGGPKKREEAHFLGGPALGAKELPKWKRGQTQCVRGIWRGLSASGGHGSCPAPERGSSVVVLLLLLLQRERSPPLLLVELACPTLDQRRTQQRWEL